MVKVRRVHKESNLWLLSLLLRLPRRFRAKATVLREADELICALRAKANSPSQAPACAGARLGFVCSVWEFSPCKACRKLYYNILLMSFRPSGASGETYSLATVLRKYRGIKARRILQKDTIKAPERKNRSGALYNADIIIP